MGTITTDLQIHDGPVCCVSASDTRRLKLQQLQSWSSSPWNITDNIWNSSGTLEAKLESLRWLWTCAEEGSAVKERRRRRSVTEKKLIGQILKFDSRNWIEDKMSLIRFRTRIWCKCELKIFHSLVCFAFWGEMNTFLDALRAQHRHPAQKHLTDERPERPRVVCSDACHMINEGRPPWAWLWGYLGLFISCSRLEETSGWSETPLWTKGSPLTFFSCGHTFTCCSRRSPQTWNHMLPDALAGTTQPPHLSRLGTTS